MTILVTGGAGFIGSHTCKLLKEHGYHPIVFDSLVRGHPSLVKWGDLVVGDLGDRDALRALFRAYRPEAVLHFAALAYVGESVREPASYFETNTAGSIQLLGAMLENNVKRLVFSSTCATYGNPLTLPITEQTPQTPVNPYGLSKLFVEQIIRTYSEACGLKAVMLRYFNASGADSDGETGEMHHPETHLIPRALIAASGGAALDVFGTDYPTSDGTCVRDYIHVTDLARAHVLALEYLLSGGKLVALNLGTGVGYSVREVLRSVERVTGRQVPVRFKNRRPGDPPALVADGTLAHRVLGWKPEFTNLDRIVSTAWEWHRRMANVHSRRPMATGAH